MKPTSCIILLCCFFCSQSICQDVPYEPYYLENLIDCDNMEPRNVVIVLDCLCAKSRIFRKRSNEDCDISKFRHQSLWKGDYVTVCLENFNPYLYSVTFENRQVDIDYSSEARPFNIEDVQPKDLTQPAQCTDVKLSDYFFAVLMMDQFIQDKKGNNRPQSRILEADKKKLINSEVMKCLKSSLHAQLLYNQINTTLRPLYSDTLKIAMKFDSMLNELRNLTYTVRISIPPIQLKSFDKFEFSVTLTDKNTKLVSKVMEYSYLIKGGLKVDQSFGVIVHGIRDQEYGLRSFTGYDTTFAIVMSPDGSYRDSITAINYEEKNEIIDESSQNKLSVGLSTLTHLYYRGSIGNRIRFCVGPEIGIATDFFPKANTRYLLGGGLLFYDGRHRFSLDMGYALGQHKVFGNGQGFGTILSGVNSEPKLVERNAGSWYLGISYNVPLVNKGTQTVE